MYMERNVSGAAAPGEIPGEIMQEKSSKMPLKQIKNSTLFGEIQTSTMTFIAYLTRFRLI